MNSLFPEWIKATHTPQALVTVPITNPGSIVRLPENVDRDCVELQLEGLCAQPGRIITKGNFIWHLLRAHIDPKGYVPFTNLFSRLTPAQAARLVEVLHMSYPSNDVVTTVSLSNPGKILGSDQPESPLPDLPFDDYLVSSALESLRKSHSDHNANSLTGKKHKIFKGQFVYSGTFKRFLAEHSWGGPTEGSAMAWSAAAVYYFLTRNK